MKRLYLLFLLLSLMSTAAFAQRVALRTDLLLWGTTTPNAGVETSISRHFTMALNGAYNAWKFGNDMKLNLYLIQPELRYWPCRKFEGHFLGVHGHYAYYNVGQIPFFSGMEDIIYRGDLYGGGITYGYHWVLGDRFSIEAVIVKGIISDLHGPVCHSFISSDESYGNPLLHTMVLHLLHVRF